MSQDFESKKISDLESELKDLRTIIERLKEEQLALQKAIIEFKRKHVEGNFDF